MRYKAAWINAEVEVMAYAQAEDTKQPWASGGPQRKVKLSFNESFADDAELDLALEAFSASVREAARR